MGCALDARDLIPGRISAATLVSSALRLYPDQLPPLRSARDHLIQQIA
jgi:hypothetical protein